MAKSLIDPVIKVSPQVVKWTITSIGDDEAHEFGHNLSDYTVIYVLSSGSATVKLQVSPDGTTFVDHPATVKTLSAPAVELIQLKMSVRSVKPVVTSGSSPNLTVFIAAVRP